MKKFNSQPYLKSIVIFTFAVVFGLWSAGFLDGYIIRFGIIESFTEAEARALSGKRVRNSCQPKPYSDLPGMITDYHKDDFGDIFINVVWDDTEAEKKGILFPTGFPKGCFKQCLQVVNPE